MPININANSACPKLNIRIKKSTNASLPKINMKNIDNPTAQDIMDFPSYQSLFEKSLMFVERLTKKSKYSQNIEVAAIEKELAEKGITIRFKNKLETAKFIKKGLEDIEKAGYELPKNFLLVPPLCIFGAGGAAAMFRKPIITEAPILLPKTIEAFSKERIKRKYESGIYSTDNISYYIHHEVGHWLHFHSKPSTQECEQIWQNADKDLIGKEVSLMALKLTDGTEFVAEVFAGLIDGKKYSPHIMDIYKQLKGPSVKGNI